jgi:hypothetical protein
MQLDAAANMSRSIQLSVYVMFAYMALRHS